MAEERLADDDKDKKYRIRINEDGEEELEIVSGEEEEEDEVYCPGLEVPEFEEDDESAADMSPRELYFVRKKREQERRDSEAKALELTKKARSLKEQGQEEHALIILDSAQQTYDKLWEVYALKLEILTKKFTEFSKLEECQELAQKYKLYVPAEERKQYSQKYSPSVLAEIEAQRAANNELGAENEKKKSDRRVKFKEQLKKSVRNFVFAFAPFIVLLIVGLSLTPYMFSDKNGVMLFVALGFYALAFIALAASVILARPLARAARRLKLNERDTSTSLGRAYLEGQGRLQRLENIYDGISSEGVASSTEIDVKSEADN